MSTSSAASFTITPFWRWAGGSQLDDLSGPGPATPSVARSVTSSGFFFAFMMSGSFT
jgi:hypothetical protein